MGPKAIHSTVLTAEEEAMVVAFRRHTLLPLDDCLYALQPTIPHLTRSSLHRCLQRHGISRLPAPEGEAAEKKRFKAYPIGYFHIDIAEVRTEKGKLHLYVGIDRTSKFAFAQLHEKADRPTAVAFLEALIEAVPYAMHTILTDNPVLSACLGRQSKGASSSPTCRRTRTAGPLACVSTASTRSAARIASSNGSQRLSRAKSRGPTTLGPTGRSSG
jgi:transposase-like protein